VYPSFLILNSKFFISSSGQAMVELAVALIIIMVLIAGLIQIGQLTGAHTRTMIAARAEAAQDAMATDYTQASDARYIYSWMAGSDTHRYTHDDIPSIATNTIQANLDMVDLAYPAELAAQVPGNALSTLGTSPDMLDEFFLVKGHASESCPTLAVIRKLVNDQATISVESDAWLVWTEGIY